MAVSWTKERIDALTVEEISALQENARIRGSDEIMNLCKQVLSTKKPARKARTSSTTKTLEAECSHQLSEFAAILANKYDLSAATATKNSEGTKGFRSHNLTAKDGQAKLGGAQRTGKVAIDRYISYRVKDDIISFGAWLATKDEPEKLMWQVFGPKHHFANFKSADELHPESFSPEESNGSGGEEFIAFEEASHKFEQLVQALTSSTVGQSEAHN